VVNEEQVLRFMRQKSYRPLGLEALLDALDLQSADAGILGGMLARMEKQGSIVKTRAGSYSVPERMNLVVGEIQVHSRGFGHILMPGRDLYVAEEDMGGAMDGDRVLARPSHGQAIVVRVLERRNRIVAGTYERGEPFDFLKPDNKRLVWPIAVTSGDSMGALDGERVVVEVTRWPQGRKGPQGRVLKRLGLASDATSDLPFILEKFGLTKEFSQEVLQQANGLRPPDAGELEGRWDLCSLPLVTIDGEDAKDFDDAVSLEKKKDSYRLGVHIADVSYYVTEGSPIDNEARKRGTSVYLVDSVVHMLPERLSTDLCSLRPGEKRLALSVFMDYSLDGKMTGHSLGPSIIQSKARLTYAEVDHALDTGEPTPVPLRDMAKLAFMLREARMERGALDLFSAEQEITLDINGNPLDISAAPRYRSHSIIEEFMLVANELVARMAATKRLPFIYRVHEEPDPAKMEALGEFLFRIGYLRRRPRRVRPRLLREVLEKSRGRPEEDLVNVVALRSLKLARYEASPSIHFGLQAPFYCHFTSPIRRYPDMVAHRVISAFLIGRYSSKCFKRWQESFPDLAHHSSERERNAKEAERNMAELKTLRHMRQKLGQVFGGIISGVVPYGFYVQMGNGAEGLVHVSCLADDYYEFREETYSLVGSRTKKRFRLGDKVDVVVSAVDLEARTLDLTLAGDLGTA
jgi:ribonuclease R